MQIAKNPAVFASGKKKLKSGFLGMVLSSQERLIHSVIICYPGTFHWTILIRTR